MLTQLKIMRVEASSSGMIHSKGLYPKEGKQNVEAVEYIDIPMLDVSE